MWCIHLKLQIRFKYGGGEKYITLFAFKFNFGKRSNKFHVSCYLYNGHVGIGCKFYHSARKLISLSSVKNSFYPWTIRLQGGELYNKEYWYIINPKVKVKDFLAVQKESRSLILILRWWTLVIHVLPQWLCNFSQSFNIARADWKV